MKTEKKKTGVIYKYTSPSGKQYIGQTINESQRKYAHKSGTSKTQTKFGKAIRKYGWENFHYEVLFKINSNDKEKIRIVLNVMEKYLINKYDSFHNGYNLNDGGEGNIGYKHTDEIKELLKTTNLKTEAQRKKIGDAMRGIPKSDAHKKRLSESNTTKRKVDQFDLEGNFINTFDSLTDAAKALNQTSTVKTVMNKLSECCLEKRRTAYKYVWKYKV